MDGEHLQSATTSGARAIGADAERFVRLFGVEISDTDLESSAEWIVRRAQHRVTTSVAFLNAHCVNTLYRDGDYKTALENMDRIFADGSGMRLAARAFGIGLRDNVNGTDLFPVLCDQAAGAGMSLYLLGARPGIAQAAGHRMQEAYPTLQIAGTRNGYFQGADQDARAIEEINASTRNHKSLRRRPLTRRW